MADRDAGSGARHDHSVDLSACGWHAGAKMSFMGWSGLLLAVGLWIYLVLALLYPEKFQ
jgi:K+-transporting ATPase KdpF subunit